MKVRIGGLTLHILMACTSGEFGRRLSSGSLMEASRSRNEIPRAEDGEKGGKGNQSDIIAVSVAIKAMCDETASNASAAVRVCL